MMQVTATADDGTEYAIGSPADLRRVLVELAKAQRVQRSTVHLAAGSAELLVGVHHDRGVLYWISYEDGDSVAIGGTNERPVPYGANEMLMPMFTELAINKVLDAVEQFVSTGRQPTCVTWLNETAAWQPHRRVAAS